MKNNKAKLIFIGILTLISLYVSVPTFIYFLQSKEVKADKEAVRNKIPGFFIKDNLIKLGLDLQGGLQLVLGVNTDEAVANRLSMMAPEVMDWAKKENVNIAKARLSNDKNSLEIDYGDSGAAGRIALSKEYKDLTRVSEKGNIAFYQYKSSELKEIKESALTNAVRVVKKRVDATGTSDTSVVPRGSDTIIVQMPGFNDPEQAKSLLGRTAQLKFKLVDETFTGFGALAGKLPDGVELVEQLVANQSTFPTLVGENESVLTELAKPFIKEGQELIYKTTDLAGGKTRFTAYVLKEQTLLTGEEVANSSVGQDGVSMQPEVILTMTAAGGRKFAQITGDNVNKLLAIILDDRIMSAPNLQTKISNGVASISMGGLNYNEVYDEATELSLVLKSGALPAKIEVLEERSVGASLGPSLATQGIKSVMLGLLFVFGFMVFYYRRPGIIACVALLLNGIFLLAIMATFNFALTLPGIAGFILTLGMAVDANVLINERIRQELEGRNAKKALDNGFSKVFWTILDANITTLIAAFILFQTNTSGPLLGFATTLMIGICVSMFTSLYCTKVFFNTVVGSLHSDQAVRKWLGAKPRKNWNINFLKFGPIMSTLYLLIAVAVIGTIATKGLNWSVDFAGGTEMEIHFDKDIPNADELRQNVKEAANLETMTMQALDGTNKNFVFRFDKATNSDSSKELPSEKVKTFITTTYVQYGPSIERTDFVGPRVGKELRKQGLESAVWAIFAILIYIFLRFDLRFGTGAVIKMVLDVFIIMAFYAFGWVTFDLSSIAALLTVIGYSVNDTIVIYDRVRENIETFPKKPLRENTARALNESFTRTLNTSITTLIALGGILIFGSGQIWNFAAAMSIGVVAATVSSLFISSSILLWVEKMRPKIQALLGLEKKPKAVLKA